MTSSMPLLQQAFEIVLDEVNAFVADQTGDHGHDGAAVLMQAELVLQGSFAGALPSWKVSAL